VLIKERVVNPDKRDTGASHVLKLSGVSEWLLFSGLAPVDAEGNIVSPGDVLGQLRWIYASFGKVLAREGYSFSDVVKIETTVTEDVPQEQIDRMFGVVGEVFGNVPIRPIGGTFRVVKALARPGMLVEVEMLAAR
jgi:enamine deaminase RidA (YjgF/YER057c/UK114 family)